MSIKRLNKVTSVLLNSDDIKKKAFEISRSNKSYDEFVWIYAESELRLKNAYISKPGPNVKEIQIDTAKIVDKPSENEIRELAKSVRSTNPSMQNLHWWIAERQIIYSKVKGK